MATEGGAANGLRASGSLLALLAFERALERRTACAFALAGGVFGLGALTKQTLLLWAPVFLFWLWRRDPALLRLRLHRVDHLRSHVFER